MAGMCLAGLICLVSGCQLFLVSSLGAGPGELAHGCVGWADGGLPLYLLYQHSPPPLALEERSSLYFEVP